MCRARAVPPVPAIVSPEFLSPVSSIIDERREFAVGHGRLRDRERLNSDLMRVQLVVENEGAIRQTAEQKLTAGYVGVAQFLTVCYRALLNLVIESRLRVAERLPRVAKRFVVHVFMKERERKEVLRLTIDVVLILIKVGHAIQHFLQVRQRVRA